MCQRNRPQITLGPVTRLPCLVVVMDMTLLSLKTARMAVVQATRGTELPVGLDHLPAFEGGERARLDRERSRFLVALLDHHFALLQLKMLVKQGESESFQLPMASKNLTNLLNAIGVLLRK